MNGVGALRTGIESPSPRDKARGAVATLVIYTGSQRPSMYIAATEDDLIELADRALTALKWSRAGVIE